MYKVTYKVTKTLLPKSRSKIELSFKFIGQINVTNLIQTNFDASLNI